MSTKWQVLVLPFEKKVCFAYHSASTIIRARALLEKWLPVFKSARARASARFIVNRNLQTSLLIVANRPDLGTVNKISASRFNTQVAAGF